MPGATFLVADMTRRIWEPASFEAVIALYSLIHVPLVDQPSVIEQVSDCLVEGGLLLATVGWEAWTGSDSDWLRGGVEMWWSQTRLVREATLARRSGAPSWPARYQHLPTRSDAPPRSEECLVGCSTGLNPPPPVPPLAFGGYESKAEVGAQLPQVTAGSADV